MDWLVMLKVGAADATEQQSAAVEIERSRKELKRLRKRCQVADRGLVHYEQMCVKLKQLCGGDVTKHDISDTEDVVRREVERLRYYPDAVQKLKRLQFTDQRICEDIEFMVNEAIKRGGPVQIPAKWVGEEPE